VISSNGAKLGLVQPLRMRELDWSADGQSLTQLGIHRAER
jgi:hypothetical protein